MLPRDASPQAPHQYRCDGPTRSDGREVEMDVPILIGATMESWGALRRPVGSEDGLGSGSVYRGSLSIWGLRGRAGTIAGTTSGTSPATRRTTVITAESGYDVLVDFPGSTSGEKVPNLLGRPATPPKRYRRR